LAQAILAHMFKDAQACEVQKMSFMHINGR